MNNKVLSKYTCRFFPSALPIGEGFRKVFRISNPTRSKPRKGVKNSKGSKPRRGG